MISFLRDRLQGIVAFSFLGIVALTFAFLGLPTFTQTFSKNNYATIGEYEISQSEYISTRNQVESSLRDQFGQSVDLSNPILFDAVEELTKNSLIERYTIIKLFDELGIDVPENYIENELSKVESFQVDGKFDQEAFKNYLINFNLSKNELMRSFSNDFKINFSVNLLSSMINSFDKDIDEYLKLVTEKRDLIFVNLTSENVVNDFEISEDDLISYYSENPNLFLVPEKRSFYEINLSPENFDFDISEEEFAAGYDAYLSSLPKPEKRVSHVMIIRENYESDDAFNSRVEEVTNNFESSTFAELVNKFTEDDGTKEADGDLGFTDGQIFPEPFESRISSLAVNEINSEPIFFESNAHFLYVTEINATEITSYEDKKFDLENEIKRIKFEEKITEISENFEGSSAAFKTFIELYNLPNKLYTEKTYADISNLQIADIVFGANLNNWSEILKVDDDEFILAFITDIQESFQDDFTPVKEKAQELLEAKLKDAYIEEIFASDEEVDLSNTFFASKFSLKNVEVEQFLDIDRSTSLFSEKQVAELFTTDKIGVVQKRLIGTDLFIFLITKRNPGSLDRISEEERASFILESNGLKFQSLLEELQKSYTLKDSLKINNNTTQI